MKKIAILLIPILMFSIQLNAQNNPVTAFLLKWENSKNYLLEMAESMPEENYNYKPTERQMTFQEQLLHIRSNMIWLSEKYFMNSNFSKTAKSNPSTKTEIIEALANSFEKVSKIIKEIPDADLAQEAEFFAGPKSKLQLINLIQDHVTHHRGQLIVYLNLKAINPPKYRGW